ncbi:uncharacterized protein [Nicotiana sylvestris]|uniref:uncharacterized protein n=1 Tax=Nicotiana sylvestris TaxID=4096 RepID=UPI00388CED06
MVPLKYIFQKPRPTGKLAKWQILLSEFDIIYVTQKAVKGQALAMDGEHEPLKMSFSDEEVSFIGEDIAESYDGWRMFFDGVENLKGVGIGAVVVSEISQHYPVSSKLKFPCTNNMTEYEACILGLKMAIGMHVQELLVIVDLDLLMHQVREEWATKNSKILSYLHHTRISLIPVKIHDQPAYSAHVEEEAERKPWFHDIKEYLPKEEYPKLANPTQKCTLWRLSNKVFHSGVILIGGLPIWDY